jgi:hypothetical protein
MGTYLATGIVKEIIIDKKRIKYPDITVDKIANRLNDELDLNNYNFTEDLEGYYWRIKPEMLASDLVAFLEAQFLMYQDSFDKYMQETIDRLKEVSSHEEVIELAKNETLMNFRSMSEIIEYITVKRDNGFGEGVMVFYSLIAYFMDGKILTEGLGNSLRYFESAIRLQKDKYPIADCVKVMITS